MPRPARPWFRFYVEAVHDPKIRELTPTQRWVWVGILAAARQSPIPGRLMLTESSIMSERALGSFCDVSGKHLQTTLSAMLRLGLISRGEQGEIVVNRWHERQYESDLSTVRTAKHRSNVVPGNGHKLFPGTDQIQRQNTDTKTISAPRARDPISDDFDRWWSGYPRKKAKPAAFKAYRAARRNGRTLYDLERAVSNLVAQIGRDGTALEFVPYPATFLNQRLDDYAVVPAAEGQVKPQDRSGPRSCPSCGDLVFLPGTGRVKCRCP